MTRTVKSAVSGAAEARSSVIARLARMKANDAEATIGAEAARLGADPDELRGEVEKARKPGRGKEKVEGNAGGEGKAKDPPSDEAVRYSMTQTGTWCLREPGKALLANFTAKIVAEVERDADDGETALFFELECTVGPRAMRISIPSREFSGMSWPITKLGARAVVKPGNAFREHLRTAIQELSPEPPLRRVYLHTGWRKIARRDVYLHAAGGIGADGPVEGVETDLTGSGLASFKLPLPPEGKALAEAFAASLGLLALGPLAITAPLLAAVARAPFGEAEFSVFLVGPSGSFKSQLAALVQQHWGSGLTAAHLPANWGSTANAIESAAFLGKDAVVVVDDFAPAGTMVDIQKFNAAAARILRAQGNNAGRGRMRADGTQQPGRPPRGLLLVTGEDYPQGESIRARCVFVEVQKGEVTSAALTEAQRLAAAGLYAQAFAGFVRHLANDLGKARSRLKERATVLEAEATAIGLHRRTPRAIAELGAALEAWLEAAVAARAITAPEAQRRFRNAWSALLGIAAGQVAEQREEDPARRFIALIGAALRSKHACHVSDSANVNDRPAADCEALGWRRQVSQGNETWAPMGLHIGWINNKDQILLLDPVQAHQVALKLSVAEGRPIAITRTSLQKRLRESGLLIRSDKDKNTYSVKINRRKVVVLALDLTSVLGSHAEGSSDDEPPDGGSGSRKNREPEVLGSEIGNQASP